MNTRHIWMTAAVMAFVFTVGVAAQSTSSSATRIQQHRDITLTGCLQAAEESRSGPTGSARPGAAPGTSQRTSSRSASPAIPERFILTNATGGSASAATSDSSEAAGVRGSTYTLEGRTAELRSHVNHRIEVTGQILSSSGSSLSSGGSSARLNVQSVRMIAVTCAK